MKQVDIEGRWCKSHDVGRMEVRRSFRVGSDAEDEDGELTLRSRWRPSQRCMMIAVQTAYVVLHMGSCSIWVRHSAVSGQHQVPPAIDVAGSAVE